MTNIIKEFKETYPDYSLGFTAYNSWTATEKAFGLRMASLLFHKNGKTYQVFNIPKHIKDSVVSRFGNYPKDKSLTWTLTNGIHITCQVYGNEIRGYCNETMERIFLDALMEFKIAIPSEQGFSDEYDTAYSQYRREQQAALYE